MISLRHWTPRYAWDKCRYFAYCHTHRGVSWLTPDANRMLAAWIRRDYRGFEWGAGRSTLWFAQRAKHLTTVEHDAAWERRIRRIAARKGLANITWHVYPQDSAEYVGAAEDEPDESLDFALVDGFQRDRCALAILPKLRAGGWLIVDNVNRYLPCASRAPNSLGLDATPLTEDWARLLNTTRDWKCTWTTSGVSDTAIWERP
ncbi:MAG TPA: hypothetical protein HPP77_01745 [Candidatus Hydrogenedentes bacterium]|nr:hypothetical protein [Candidatus Hydrogenedentota bacterium]HIJ74016.1 hypothetical protein [Candidatus Hydrogenedentota bacterium]